MTVIDFPAVRVEGPPFQRARFGLLSVADVVDEGDGEQSTPNWEGGTWWESVACTIAGASTDPCLVESRVAPQVWVGEVCPNDYVGTLPFQVYVLDQSGPGLVNGEAGTDRLAAMLNAGESYGLELEVWGGAARNGGGLVAVADELGGTAATPVSIQRAFALVEEAIGACYGGVGVIHLGRKAATLAVSEGLIVRQGNRLETVLGTLVAAGVGYPSGPDANEMAVIGTGAVQVRRSAISYTPTVLAQAVVRATNDLSWMAARTYTVGWECCAKVAWATAAAA